MNELYDFNSKKDVFEFYNSANSSQKDKYEKSVLQCILVQNVDELHIFGLMLLWSDYIKTGVKKYSLITEVVYSIDSKKIDEEIYNNNLDKFGEVCTRFQLLNAEGKDKYLKGLYNHIQLAKQQKIYIDQNIKNLTSEISDAEKKLNEIKEIKGKIYTEFIAILGIFTSIIFAVLGGFNELKTLGASISTTYLPKLLIFMSLLMLGVNFLVFLSFNAISKLTGISIKSCKCGAGEDSNRNCECNIRDKHPTMYFSTLLFLAIMFLGFGLGALYDKTPNIELGFNQKVLTAYSVSLIPFTIFIVIICTVYMGVYKQSRILEYFKSKKKDKE